MSMHFALPFCFNRPCLFRTREVSISKNRIAKWLLIPTQNPSPLSYKACAPYIFAFSLMSRLEKRGYLLIQSSVSYVISNARECRRMYVSIDIYLLAHSFFEQRTVQLLNLWSESIFANSTHWLESTHAPGFFEVSRLFDVRKSDS